jgi:hypothetical protein
MEKSKTHSSFEAVKIALKQDKTGYVLTLNIHPDDLDEAVLRDFVGARYGVAMVRIDGNEQPMDREEHEGDKAIRVAGILCRDPDFWNYLYADSQIMLENEKESTEWLRHYLNVQSRSELKTNNEARELLAKLHKDIMIWKQRS